MSASGDHRLAVVTGAASGIGRAAAARLRGDGWGVVLVDASPGVENVAAELGAEAAVLDVANAEAVAALAGRLNRLDGLVTAAGAELNAPLGTLGANAWRRAIDVNLTGQFLFLHAFLPQLRARRGSVVCVSSVVGRAAYPGATAYAAAKAGIEGLVRAAAIDAAPDVRVNCVLPGTTDTAMLRGDLSGAPLDALLKEAGASVPLGRVARPEEIAAVVAFLLSPDASYVSGASIVADGALQARLATNV